MDRESFKKFVKENDLNPGCPFTLMMILAMDFVLGKIID